MTTYMSQARSALAGKPTTGPDASVWARLGYWAAVSMVQVLVVEFVVSATWRGLYSYRTNFISELGVAFCGPTGNWPCSKLYVLMNASITVLGVSMVLAAFAWMATGVLDPRGGVLLTIAGGGAGVAGVFNQGLNYPIHSFGATLLFVVGSLALVVAGGHHTLRRPIRITVTTLGTVGMSAALFFIGGHHFGLGIGAIERISVYSIIIGCIVLAVAHRSTARRVKALADSSPTDSSPADDGVR